MSASRTLMNKQGRKPGVRARMRWLFPVDRAARMKGQGHSMSTYLALFMARMKVEATANGQRS